MNKNGWSQVRVRTFVALMLLLAVASVKAESMPRVARFIDESSVVLVLDGKSASLQVGEHLGNWTLMEIVKGTARGSVQCAVLEDFAEQNGRLIFADSRGVKLALPKTSEATSADPARLYFGHTMNEILNSPTDLLGGEVLAKPGDPEYDDIAAAFPPIRNMGTYTFLGNHGNFDKIGFGYGGRTANFDPAPYDPPIVTIRERGEVRDGLIGGYLPILRFVYPESEGNWSEMIAFAPLRVSNGNNRVQPVWYRISRIEDHLLKWTRYVDSYHPFPPRTHYDPKLFYADILQLNSGWNQMLGQAMKIDVPDQRLLNMSRFALIKEMMTRVGDFPKYGAVDKDYAGSEHDGFPDTFTVDTTAMLEWGLIDLAGRYVDNYFGKFVRDDGSLLYRGPETGQYGRMLTVAAEYVNYGGDPSVLIRNRRRIDGITSLLLDLRSKAKGLPPTDPAYGMIAGWSEADASLDPDPSLYMQPYFSNSTEAARGIGEIGRVWQKLGEKRNDGELTAWGKKLQRESKELLDDVQTSISRSILKVDGENILPAIAGVRKPFHVVVLNSKSDPQFRSYRAYMEMMYSGNLTAAQVKMIVDYRSHHHDVILGMPTAYGLKTGILAGFLSYGHGYGLIQYDMIREALLLTYSDMAHQYTRGSWSAPEARSIVPGDGAAPFCTPAQLVVALMTKWLLVFEDSRSQTVWLGKGVPRKWLEDGKKILVANVPTRWGRLSFTVVSHLRSGVIQAHVQLPRAIGATSKLRLRVPGNAVLKSVTLNGEPWTNFDVSDETITIPAGIGGSLSITARY